MPLQVSAVFGSWKLCHQRGEAARGTDHAALMLEKWGTCPATHLSSCVWNTRGLGSVTCTQLPLLEHGSQRGSVLGSPFHLREQGTLPLGFVLHPALLRSGLQTHRILLSRPGLAPDIMPLKDLDLKVDLDVACGMEK